MDEEVFVVDWDDFFILGYDWECVCCNCDFNLKGIKNIKDVLCMRLIFL